MFGRQRYGVAEGFKPIVQRIEGTSAAHVLAVAVMARLAQQAVVIVGSRRLEGFA
ncbi:MAG: hypothetical protein QOF68_755 [Gaiellales bacterium]|nr:hypothetical protein [Gaiellales bacterium]